MEERSMNNRLVFAYYVTGHGFGHATRVVEVVRNLIQAGHEVHVVTGAPDHVFTSEIQSPSLFIRKVLLDCGAVQADALTVDRLASLEKYVQTAVVPRASVLAIEVEWLKSVKADLVVSDIVPVACRAAADAGIRSVCVTNFSWDFIYAEYILVAGHHSRSIVWQIAEDYSHSEFLIRLPGYCPMPAFHDSIDVPLIVRRLHKSPSEVRQEFGIGEETKILIYNFGGQSVGWKLEKKYLPDGWICLVCGASEGQVLPENFVKLPENVYTPDVIAASDCMLGKIGYGTASEALAYKVPFIFVRRDYFNEEPFVRNMLEYFQCGVEMIRRDLITGRWAPYLERALTLKPCYEAGTNGGEVVAQILQDTASGKDHSPCKLSGSRRLRDAIVLGYQLQRFGGNDIGVPEWYTLAQNELGICIPSPDVVSIQRSSATKETEDFEILHGDHLGLSDTIGFLKILTELRTLRDQSNDNKHISRESLAAAVMFNWEVSFGSELGNRAPTFDMDLSDLMEGEKPISYEKANRFFAQDPSQKWAAYVAGTLLVLMTELGVRFADGISMLVFSGVPEGKGVSSSASVEVATMSAIAASLGLDISPRELALLCQKVENHIVGAPCGVMDQMASACGEENKLLAMLCQPAEVLGHVEIPNHIRFWGIDSGIRHSVGGADYGSVRIGAFMGRKIIKSTASEKLESVSNTEEQRQIELLNDEETSGPISHLLEAESALDYLCNLPPHRYEESYVHKIPETLLGNDFVKKYVHHDDSVTVIDKKLTYAVRAPTRHPVYENFRVKAFKALLSAAPSDDQLSALGELMYQCHYSYSACGLGSDGTDRLVELVQKMQHSKSSKLCGDTLFGAKITGGGSGGTVCVVGKNLIRSSEQILEIQQKYKAATGFLPFLFEGSSPGAGKFGYLKLRFKPHSNRIQSL